MKRCRQKGDACAEEMTRISEGTGQGEEGKGGGGGVKRDGDKNSLWLLRQINSRGRILADMQIQIFIQNEICRD